MKQAYKLKEPQVADFLVARVSLLSPLALDSLRLLRTTSVIDQILSLEQEMERLTGDVETALHQLVPSLEDKQVRRRVLELKRDIHNGRTPVIDPAIRQVLTDRLAAGMSACLQRWIDAAQQRSTLSETAHEAFAEEIVQANDALLQLMDEPLVQQGLALSSPDFLQVLLDKKVTSTENPAARYLRTCFSYATRIAAKTSPFSTFTRLGIATFSSEESYPEEDRSFCYVSRALTMSWLMACARNNQVAAAFSYAPNPSLRQESKRWVMLAPQYLCTDGFFHRQDNTVDVSGYLHLVELVQRVGPASYDDYVKAIGGTHPHQTFVRLLSTHLVRPVAPYSPTDPNPLRSLAAAVFALRTDYAQNVAMFLEQLSDRVVEFASGSGERRLKCLADMDQLNREGFASLGQSMPGWAAKAGIIYEDRSIPHPIPELGHHVQSDLQLLGQLMRPQVIRSHLYDHLVEHFVTCHGVGGTCQDVIGYLTSFAGRPDFMQLLLQALEQDKQAMSQYDHPNSRHEVGPSMLPPTAMVYFQIAAPNVEAVRRGHYLLIPNAHNPGVAGVMARFQPLLSPKLPEVLRAWHSASVPGAEMVDFPIFADWSTLQHNGLGKFPVLQWPTESPVTGPANAVAMDELRLIHDRASNSLVLLNRNGTPVVPLYQGVVGQYLLRGAVRLFMTLVDPWVVGHRVGHVRYPFDDPEDQPVGIEYMPRLSNGRIVLRRACWRVPQQEFPVQSSGESGAAYMRRVLYWQQSHGIPTEVFISQVRKSFTWETNKRKPMWVRFDSYHSLVALKPLLEEDSVCLKLIEALPGRNDHWVAADDHLPRVAEFLALVRWPEA